MREPLRRGDVVRLVGRGQWYAGQLGRVNFVRGRWMCVQVWQPWEERLRTVLTSDEGCERVGL